MANLTSQNMPLIAPPPNKGMIVLNKDAFKQTLELVALRVDAAKSGPAMSALKGGTLLGVPRLRAIVDDPTDPARRLILLNPTVQDTDIEKLPRNAQEFARTHGAEVMRYRLELNYDYWNSDQVLRSILPDTLEAPSSFETIGHIAHLNLRDEYQPYKKIIGEVLVDKCKNITTVVNKTDNIHHTFRFFTMELLAGEENMVAELKESNCRLRFDFSRVYWNSRLQGEHDRLVRKFRPGQLICDVFAGVGPFALPAARNANCVVFANDLNPESFRWLNENIKLNKIDDKVRAYNMDGRDFISQSLVDLNNPATWEELRSKSAGIRKSRAKKKAEAGAGTGTGDSETSNVSEPTTPAPEDSSFRVFDHYVMNLPATAIEFLDAFRGLLHGKEDVVPQSRLPIIHCHCFSRAADATADVTQRVEAIIGTALGDNLMEVYDVRDVAPNKEMLCISFRLPAEVAFAEPLSKEERSKRDSDNVPHESAAKRVKVRDNQAEASPSV
ncbi:tRNA(m(1)G37)methyltransferase [Borealophlyctis nickersoniae]|nr:tRNA(m(1)G37)methyltransferase [Borealophlyctis nickersoniae]